MKKLVCSLGALLLLASMAQVAYAGGNSRVVYTWTYTDLGQGVWGGGPLFADGSAAGYMSFSAEDGQLIFQLQPTGWSEPDPGSLDLCFAVREIKGSSGFPPSICTSDLGLLVSVTGTPIIVPNPFEPGEWTLIRVTRVN